MMDLRILRYFVTVVHEGSITRAAEVLHITQPTLSRQLAQMEEELNAALFSRGKKIVLTDDGILLYRRAQEILELADKTERELGLQDGEPAGTISIGSGEIAATQVISDIIVRLKQKYPQLHYDLISGNADLIKTKIDSGLIDIGLLLEPVSIEKYNFVRLNIKERWVVLMRADDPLAQKSGLTPKDLCALPIILSRREIIQNEIESWFGKHFKDLNIFATHTLSEMAAILVEKGLGYAIVIEGSVTKYSAEKFAYVPLFPELTGSSVLVWKKHSPPSPAAAKFIEEVRLDSRF